VEPNGEGAKDGQQLLRGRGESVFDAGRHFGEYGAGDEAIALELAQLKGEHALCDLRYQALQLTEA
jgi:hypothetical protein